MPVLSKVAGLFVANHSRNINSVVIGSLSSFTLRRYLGIEDFSGIGRTHTHFGLAQPRLIIPFWT